MSDAFAFSFSLTPTQRMLLVVNSLTASNFAFSFSLTPTQRGELQAHLKSRNLPAGMALRMRIVLMLDEGASYSDIKEKLDTTAPTISLWKRRYREAGVVA